MSEIEFWEEMAERQKTTGSRDYSISLFDQKMRIKCIEKIILSLYNEEKVRDMSALDFGCGKGDFIEYFSNKFKGICGYDISKNILDMAKKRLYYIKNAEFITDLDDINWKFDIAISVTVLQHILSDEELLNILKEINSKLNAKSIFIALESIENNKFPANKLSYIKARKVKELEETFKEAGFELMDVKNFYNPYLIQTNSFEKYKTKARIPIFLYKVFKKMKINTRVFNSLFEKYAQDVLSEEQNIDGLVNLDSFTKIFIFKKI